MTHRSLFDGSRRQLWAVVAACCLLAVHQAQAANDLKVIVIDGDEAANIVAERIAAEPVVEVRDKNDRRVPGAVVRFVIRKTRDRLVASFGNGQAEVRTITDYTGRASVNAVSPVEAGSFQIDVEVSYRGQTGKAVIRQTNFPTTADAKRAGREPGKSTSSATQAATAGGAASATGAATAATAGATGTTATATSAAASAGGGMSKAAVVGLLAGGAAGAGAAVVLTRKESAPPAIVAPIVASQATGIHSATVFTFAAQGTGFEAASLAYRWEFGDGATSTDPSPTHVYEAPGTYTVTVTVSDARQSARSDTSVTILGLTATWVRVGGGITWFLTQSGGTLTGTSDVVTVNPTTGEQTVYTGCALSGSIQRATPVAVTLIGPGCSHPQAPFLRPAQINVTVASDGMTMTGVFSPVGQAPFPITVTRQ